ILYSRPITQDAESTWKMVTQNVLTKVFGSDSPNVRGFAQAGMDFSIGAGNEAEWEQQRAKRMQSMLSRLSGLIGMLEAQAQVEAKTLAPTSNPSADRRQLHSVFLVHGHNEAYTQETARFIENFGIKVIILKEQPNEGRTIIEKFEDHAGEAGFAVV